LSDEDYEHAKKSWLAFGCKTMRDYHDHYLKTDVLLLADVFENFRHICMTHFQLDPAHYYTLPGFAWDACLKTTDVCLNLTMDPDLELFFQNNMRGGVAQISHRHAIANNPYIKDFNPDEDRSYITYLDCNNLYGTAMMRPLPTGNFRFLTEEEINRRYSEFQNATIPTDSDKGYALDVDFEYPADLHDSRNDYPLAPERMTVSEDMLSPYCLSFANRPKPTEKTHSQSK